MLLTPFALARSLWPGRLARLVLLGAVVVAIALVLLAGSADGSAPTALTAGMPGCGSDCRWWSFTAGCWSAPLRWSSRRAPAGHRDGSPRAPRLDEVSHRTPESLRALPTLGVPNGFDQFPGAADTAL